MLPNATVNILATVVFGIALVHTFSTRLFGSLAHRWPDHARLFHLLGEVECVFGAWAMVLVALMALVGGSADALAYAESREYTEPLFVFVVMVVAASRPVLQVVRGVVSTLARAAPVAMPVATAWLGLTVVPLLGSLVTEPAAMTIAALTLAPIAFRQEVPKLPKYLALGTLFVNVSIGGTLTSYAAPPVLMVAKTWNWDSAHMLANFGWKAALAVVFNASVATLVLRSHLPNDGAAAASTAGDDAGRPPVPPFIVALHLAVLAGLVVLAHHPVAFLGLFMLFLGFTQAYGRYQDPLIIREALLVGFFLAGLVVLGGLQQWWLQPLVSSLSPRELFFGAVGLTALTDNAALTYLGSLIDGISEEAKYALVAGAVTGGGLTVIANAPNPAGVALLRPGFSDGVIGAGGLLLGALPGTVVAMAAFMLP